jgi:4-amino-4-deoxychorismate lyase
MSLFIETIKIDQGKLKNLEYHQERFEQTRLRALGLKSHPLLEELIQVPEGLEKGLFKCRVSYEKEIVLVEYEPYTYRKVQSLKIVHSDSIDYSYKYADRSELEKLLQKRGECDDILVVKNACISDSYYANLIFWDGSIWATPDTPLLPGTMRASLLKKGLIKESRITPDDLAGYQKLKLINAMNDLEHAPEISIESIHL